VKDDGSVRAFDETVSIQELMRHGDKKVLVLQRAAASCRVLQRVAVRCSVMQCVAICCILLQ